MVKRFPIYCESYLFIRFIIVVLFTCLLALPPMTTFADGTISYGQTVTGYIDSSNIQDYWRFSGTVGDKISIEMRLTSGCLDSYLILRDPGGNMVEEHDDIGDWRDCANGPTARLRNVSLSHTGAYTIEATRYRHGPGATVNTGRVINNTGNYRLKLSVEQSSQQQQAQLTVQGNQGQITAGGYRVDLRYGLETISLRQINVNDCGTIGNPAACNMRLLDVVDLSGYIEQGVGFCFPRRGAVLFLPSHDANGQPIDQRYAQPIPLPYRHAGNETCVNPVPRAGKLLLVPSAGAHPPSGGSVASAGSCSLPAELQVGDRAIRVEGANSNMRSEPSGTGRIVGRISGGETVDVLEGPTAAGGFQWYKVMSSSGEAGWVAESGPSRGDCAYYLTRGGSAPAVGSAEASVPPLDSSIPSVLVGGEYTGTLAEGDAVYRIQLRLTAPNNTVAFTLTSTELNMVPGLTLWNSDGEEVATDSNNDDAVAKLRERERLSPTYIR